MPIGPSFKQLQILRLFDGVYYYKPGSSPQLKKNLLINHFCAKKQILSRYSQSAWLLSILGKFHHISPTLNAILPRQTVPYEKTPRIEYIYIYMWGLLSWSKPSQNCGPIWKSSPLWGGENCPQDTKNTPPQQNKQLVPPKKKRTPLSKRCFFPHLGNQNIVFMWNILIFWDFKTT